MGNRLGHGGRFEVWSSMHSQPRYSTRCATWRLCPVIRPSQQLKMASDAEAVMGFRLERMLFPCRTVARLHAEYPLTSGLNSVRASVPPFPRPLLRQLPEVVAKATA